MELNKEYIKSNSEVNIETDCWLWSGYCNPDGYGQRKINGVTIRMHRAAHELFIGGIPKDMQVLHKCDIPGCCNPEHLFIGTHSDNMQDMWDKGRHPIPKSTHSRKLNSTQVRIIRKLQGKLSGDSVGRIFNVCSQTIYNLWRGVYYNEA